MIKNTYFLKEICKFSPAVDQTWADTVSLF